MCDGYGRIKVHGFSYKKRYTVYHNFVYMWYTVHIRRLDKEKVVTDIGELDP
jgi:hypothetical protein